MNNALNVIGARVNGYPLFLLAALSLISISLALLCRRSRALARVQRACSNPQRVLTAIGWILAGSYVALVLFYVCSSMSLDNGEVEHICTAYWFKTGHPLYHAPDAAERYSVGYGPMAYIPFAVAMTVLGHSFLACKILTAFCGAVYFVLIYRCLSRETTPKAAFLWSTLIMALSLAHWYQTFYAKADPILYICLILALWAAIALRPKIATLVLAVTLGTAINIKLPAVLYFAYPVLLMVRRIGWRAVLIALAGAGLLAILPFFHPQISFRNWTYWLNQERRQGLGLPELIWNVQWFVFLLLLLVAPLMKAGSPGRRPGLRLETWGLLASLALMAFSASKAGSGPNHLVPFVPMLCYAAIRLWKDQPQGEKESLRGGLASLTSGPVSSGLLIAYLATSSLLAIHALTFMLYPLCTKTPISSQVNADVELIIAGYPGKTIAMGTGAREDYRLSNYRLPLIFAGQPYFLDQTALMGHEAAGIPIPQKTLDVLAQRKIDIWLIPKHAPPFEIRNFYPPNRNVFDDRFLQTFHENYELRGWSRFFDLYLARPHN